MTLLIVSIALEVAVAIIAALAASRGRPYLYGLAFTFGVYVLYDLGRLLGWPVEKGILPSFMGERRISRQAVIAALPVSVT